MCKHMTQLLYSALSSSNIFMMYIKREQIYWMQLKQSAQMRLQPLMQQPQYVQARYRHKMLWYPKASVTFACNNVTFACNNSNM